MKIELSRNSKRMIVGMVVTLAILVCSGFDACNILSCIDSGTQESKYPGFWVSCVEDSPILMTYYGNNPAVVADQQQGAFNPGDWDCSHPNSPAYRGSQATAIQPGTAEGPAGYVRLRNPQRQAASGAAPSQVAYLPPILRDLPFFPGASPPALQCDSSMPDVFQTVHTNALVTRISTCPFQIKARIPVASRPLQIQITPDGSTALVTSFDNAVNFINLATNTVSFTLQTDPAVTPHGLAIAPDGTRAYITNYSMTNPEVLEIDLATRKIVAAFPTTFPWPQGATFTPDGSQLWVNTDNFAPDAGVDVFDTLTNTLVTSLNIMMPTDIAFNSTGTVAYITSSGNTPGQVFAIDTATFKTIETYTVGAGPADIAMSYGDQFLVVNNSDGTVSVIDLVKQKVSSTQAGTGPVSGIAFVK